MTRALLALSLASLLATALSGCATVRPWERERLAHPYMQVEPALGDAWRMHELPIREGALSGEGHVGGGCGCN